MNNFNSSDVEKSRECLRGSHSLSHKLVSLMIIVTVLQLLVFFAVMIFGGEFSYIRRYAYENFREKNSNRKNYIENMLLNKTDRVNGASKTINADTGTFLEQNSKTFEDIKTDKELNRSLVSEWMDTLVELLRQDQVNDAYIILDTGDLYSTPEHNRKYGIYIRDIDPSQSSENNSDLLMEIGNSDLAAEHGITLDFEWAATLDVTDNSDNRFGFFFDTMEAAENIENGEAFSVGRWYTLTGISKSAQKSIKFSMPLISDGVVYGVLGIGVTEKFVADMFPSYDNIDNEICYILASDLDSDGIYEPQMHLGPVYSRVVRNTTSLGREHRIEGEIYDFNYGSDIDSIGNIQEMELYNPSSVFRNEKWAVIAVGEKSGVMAVYDGLLDMMLLSSAISVVLSLIGAIIIGRETVRPVSYMIDKLNEGSKDKDGIIRFAPTGICEVDRLGGRIVDLQIDVKETASRVSGIIDMADMAIGVFMYTYDTGDVFISQSLIRLLGINEYDGTGDEIISIDKFKAFLDRIDPDKKISSNSLFDGSISEDKQGSERCDIEIKCSGSDSKWLKFSLTRDSSNLLGLAMDITETVQEKQRIEFERDYDVTTGLLNRRAFLCKINALFSNRGQLKTAAAIMLDLDNLKYVNDTYGHESGDEYIHTAAKILSGFEKYGGIVARMSGDEFNIFLYGYRSKDEVRRIVNDVLSMGNSFKCALPDGSNIRVRASSGLAWYPDDADTYEMLFKYADFSMYTIKHSTKGNLAEFDPEVYNRDSILMTGIEEVNRIIDTEAVRFAFQPIVSVRTGKIYGYEMLMRPQSELIRTPLDFIRLAKTHSKMHEIERLTWLKGLEAFHGKTETGEIPKDCHVFVNSLSNCEINSRNISYIEKNYGDILKNVVLEVLEGENENETYTEDKQKLMAKWQAQIALDDYGSGYNSELLFIKLSPDIIKIDRSIIIDCDKLPEKENIIKEIIRMAKSKNTAVLAEGAETAGEIRTVIKCGVDLIQGYYIGKPAFDPQPVTKKQTEEILSYAKFKEG